MAFATPRDSRSILPQAAFGITSTVRAAVTN